MDNGASPQPDLQALARPLPHRRGAGL